MLEGSRRVYKFLEASQSFDKVQETLRRFKEAQEGQEGPSRFNMVQE